MIQTEGLTKQFGQLVAVDNLNLHIEKGEIYGFLGPNGAGKTTTAMMILGLLKPTAGKVKIFGKELHEDYFNIKRRIGVLSEFQYLYEDLTAYECLRFFGELYQVDDIDKRITHVLGLVNLDHRKHELLSGYSKGMKQKFGMARALLHDPDILILDEPVSSLDPYGVKEIRDIIMEENRNGRTFLISSHILSEIEKTCHRIGILNRGRLVAEDTMDNIRHRLESEVELHIEIDSANEAVAPAVQAIDGVLSLEVDAENPKKYVIKTTTQRDVRPDIVRAIASCGNVVIDFRKHEMSLEEAFVTITEKNISLLAKEGVA